MKKIMIYSTIIALTAIVFSCENNNTNESEIVPLAQSLPKATISIVKDNGKVKVHTLVAPGDFFANTSHIIELSTQLIIIDGQFFAQYAQELKTYAESLKKPITRIYISHDHPDHFIGFGDAFPNTNVYALKEIKESIEKTGESVLQERQKSLGKLIASKLNAPKFEVTPGKEIIDGVTLIFDKVENAESSEALTIKIPELGVYIAQDIVYNRVHLFISGPTAGWKKALTDIKANLEYTIILPGHGNPATQNEVQASIAYLDKVDEILKDTKTANEYRTKILAAYPDYAAPGLIDIYLPFLFK